MSAASSSVTFANSHRRLLLSAVVIAAGVFAAERTGVDVGGLCRDGFDGCARAAGVAMTLSGGLGLALLPGSIAAIRRHPLLSRPLRRPGATPVSGMRRFWPTLCAYWTSDRWVEAWSLTLAVFAITTLISMSSVWLATASANFLASLVSFHSPSDGADPVAVLVMAVTSFAAISLARHGLSGVRNFASTTLHRKARRWTQEQFSAALLGRNHVAMNLASDRDGSAGRLPDNIDQRLDENTNAMYSGVIGLSIGIFGAVTSIYFVSAAIIERSVAVPLLDAWIASAAHAIGTVFGERVGEALTWSPGEYGAALLVAIVIGIYIPLSTLAAGLIGSILQRQTLERQSREATWRGELKTMMNRSALIATSHGERVQEHTNAKLYAGIDDVWHRMNITQSAFMAFSDAHTFLSTRLVAYLPALPAYLAGSMSFRRYSATSELAAQVINDCSWFIQVMPAIVTMRSHVIRLNELARAIEAANDEAAFYAATGVHDFRRSVQDPRLGLTLRNVALHHRGHDTTPFLAVERMTLRPGQWAFVRGANGSGKSSLLKAIAGLWPYGSGDVVLPAGGKLFFAGQDPDLAERLTLKELVAYPDFADAHGDVAVAAVLEDVGLGKFIRHLGDALYEGKPWSAVFSGGQRQRLVLARILLQQPDVILLDEACAALDPAGVHEFHALLKQHCGAAIVVSVMHMPEPPLRTNGRPYYDRILYIQDGLADLHALPIGRSLVPLAAE